MKCFNCGYPMDKNDLTNCKVCGSKYPISCPSCEGHNPMHAQFCMSCGKDLSSVHEAIKPIVESRKNVGVLFADVSGFTKLAKMLDPEELRELINECFQYITRPVYELEGTIDKYIGDCVMVVFGNEYTHSDDSFRTIKCAIEMMKLIDEFSAEKSSKLKMELNLSIGVNYGLVVTGNVGNLYESDYTVLGDTVNIAQRLQTSANPGEILASEEVYLDTKEYIHYGSKKSIKVKNIDKQINAYHPISLRQETILDAQYIVEREEDLSLLETQYFNRDDNHFNMIIAASGVGKTTLVKKFISSLDPKVRKVWINASPIFKDKPYYALSKIIAAILNINPEDTSRIKRNRLISFSDYILADYSETEIIKNYNFIALLMGLDRDNGYEEIINTMEYHDLQREIVSQVALLLEKISERQDLYFILDDAHLMDKETIISLSELKSFNGYITFITQYPLPEIESCTSMIELHPFSISQTNYLIEYKLNHEVEEEFVSTIFTTTKGNPMHISELLLMIKRNNLLIHHEGAVSLHPDFMQLVTSSLDHIISKNIQLLGQSALQFLTYAAVIGNEFNIHWLQMLHGSDVSLDAFLSEAIKYNLIEFSSVKKSKQAIERVYSFTQNSTRQVIYNTLLHKDKRDIHSAIARLLEKEYIDSLEQYYELLAYHYENGNVLDKAKEYYYKTAEQFMQNYIAESAIKNYEKYLSYETKTSSKLAVMFTIAEIDLNLSKYDEAFTMLEQASQIAKFKNDLHLIDLMKIKIYKETTNFDEAIPLLESLSEKLDRKSNLYGRLLQLKSTIYNMIGKQEVIELAKQSEEILLKSRDYATLSETMSQAGIRYFIGGDMQNGIEYLLKAYDYAKQSKNLNTLTKITINLGIFTHASGEIDQSFAYLEDARELALQVSNIKNYLSASINLGVFNLEKGLFGNALTIFDEAIAKSQENHLIYQTCIALTNQADIQYELGEYNVAIKTYQEALKLAEIMKLPIEQAITEQGIAKSYLGLNLLDEVEPLLQKVKEVFSESNEVVFLIDNDIFMSNYLLLKQQDEDALKLIDLALEHAKEIHHDQKEVEASRLKVKILLSLKQEKEALELIEKALTQSYELESDYEVAKTAFLACIVFAGSQDFEKAKQFFDVAQKHIKHIDSCYIKTQIMDFTFDQ